MFYNNQNDGNNKPSVNTHYESFFGDLSYMIVSGWDANVSFKFAPCVGTNDSGRKQYDKDRTVTSALTHPKIAALLAQYETKMESKIKNNEDPGEGGICVGVPVRSGRGDTSTTSAFFIEYARGEKGPETYFTLIKNISPGGTPSVIRYKFDPIPTLDGTSAQAGNYTQGEAQGEFFWFIDLLKAHAGVFRFGDHSRRMSEQLAARSGNMPNGGGAQQNFNTGNMMNSPEDFNMFN